MDNGQNYQQAQPFPEDRFCRYCGAEIPADARLCPYCGAPVENAPQPGVVINNTYNTYQQNVPGAPTYYVMGRPRSKWTAFLLCFFLGYLGAHKFYDGKIGMGILYLFTGGLFVVGVVVDLILILLRPDPYYV